MFCPPPPFAPVLSTQTHRRLVNLLVRKPLARLQVLLLQRGIQHAQTPYFARRRRVVAFYVGFGLAVGGLEGEGTCSLFLVVKTLVVVFKNGCAFCFSRIVFGVCVGRVACEDFLPEGEAAGGACGGVGVSYQFEGLGL